MRIFVGFRRDRGVGEIEADDVSDLLGAVGNALAQVDRHDRRLLVLRRAHPVDRAVEPGRDERPQVLLRNMGVHQLQADALVARFNQVVLHGPGGPDDHRGFPGILTHELHPVHPGGRAAGNRLGLGRGGGAAPEASFSSRPVAMAGAAPTRMTSPVSVGSAEYWVR